MRQPYLGIDSYLLKTANELGFRFSENAIFGSCQGLPAKIEVSSSGYVVIAWIGDVGDSALLRDQLVQVGQLSGLKIKPAAITFDGEFVKIEISSLTRPAGVRRAGAALRLVPQVVEATRGSIECQCRDCGSRSFEVVLAAGRPVAVCEQCTDRTPDRAGLERSLSCQEFESGQKAKSRYSSRQLIFQLAPFALAGGMGLGPGRDYPEFNIINREPFGWAVLAVYTVTVGLMIIGAQRFPGFAQVLMAGARSAKFKPLQKWVVIFMWPVTLAGASYFGMVFLNCHFDHSRPSIYRAEVVADPGRRNLGLQNLDLKENYRLPVASRHVPRIRYRAGQTLDLSVKPGAFGVRWISAVSERK